MSQKFQATVHQRDDVTFVKLAGVIDEDNELSDLVDKLGGGTCVIDLGEVERINSCGVRDWVRCVAALERQGANLVLVGCSAPVVRQLNTVHNFRGNAAIKSFFAPYFCRSCERELKLLCELSDMVGPPYQPPIKRCDNCERVLEFDDMPDSYFLFLTNTRPYVDNRSVRAVLDELASDDEDTRAIRRRVDSQAPPFTGIPRTLATGGSGSIPTLSDIPSVPTAAATPFALAHRPPDDDAGDTIIDAPRVFPELARPKRRPIDPAPYIALALATAAGATFAAALTAAARLAFGW